MQAADQCVFAITFAPVAQGPGDATANVRVLGGAPQSLRLTGTGTATGTLASSITALRTDGGIAYAGSPVSLTATWPLGPGTNRPAVVDGAPPPVPLPL